MAEENRMVLDMKRVCHGEFEKKAEMLKPELLRKKIYPQRMVTISEHQGEIEVVSQGDPQNMRNHLLARGESLCLDFGNHLVGYVTLKLKAVGSPQDSPAYLRLKFGEVAKEILERSEDYDGWISRGWIQEEFLHIDVLPIEITLPRRYAFRYLEIMAVDTSKKWKLSIEAVSAETVSAVDMDTVEPFKTEELLLANIDQVSLRTLQNCMQSVFEDGPKRDRRLWIGDLRLQALANYETFRKNDLVKRSLYLFAGQTREDGQVSACLFLKPEYIVDDTFLFDYSLFFIPCLWDYYNATEDQALVEELWDCAYRQYELGRENFDENHCLKYNGDLKCFIDWKEGLDKQASAQAVYIYCLRRLCELAGILEKEKLVQELEREIMAKSEAAIKYFWDQEKGLFVSGEKKQISYASQIWMILAGVVKEKTAKQVLSALEKETEKVEMVTPYMNHHYVEALLMAGEKEKALNFLKYYWGGMIKEGADTFYELYNPENPKESPYGSSMVNSYCHAWSCTPAYFFRKYFK